MKTFQIGFIMIPRFPVLGGLLLLLCATASAQEVTYKNRCPNCDSTGRIENPFFSGIDPLPDYILLDSFSIERDEQGLGMPWIPCDRCRNEALYAKAVEEFAVEAEKRKQWLEEMKKVDEVLKSSSTVYHVETAHFTWAWDIPKVDWEKKTYRDQKGLYLFAGLMETFYEDFQRVHGITDLENYNNHHYIYCLERQTVSRRACIEYCGKAVPGGKTYKSVKPSVFVTWWNKSTMPSEEDLHRDLIHTTVHLLTAVHKTPNWFYKDGFAYEGIAHWWEMYYYKKATSHCFWELLSLSDWISTKWESKVKKAVKSDKQPALTSFIDADGGSLTAEQHVYSWSYIDYMMSMDPNRILVFFDVLKQKRPVREAFMEAWDLSILGFEEKWKEFVKSTYKIVEDPLPPRRRRR